MLPVDLCRLCSLTPGEDKLAFSVFWKVKPDLTLSEPRFTRSVLHSSCQMSYEQAQVCRIKMNPGSFGKVLTKISLNFRVNLPFLETLNQKFQAKSSNLREILEMI